MTTTKKTLLRPITKEDNHFLLASHLPQGNYLVTAFSKDYNLGKLVYALCLEYYRIQVLTEIYSLEFDINSTERLLEEWEKSVGIPSDCIPIYGKTIEERRKQLEGVFGNFKGVQTADDFERVCLIFGFEVDVTPGPGVHEMTVNVTNIPPGVYFPLTFPIQFAGGGITFLQCLLDSLAPANVEVIITTTI
jgi:hypothetical protein